MSLTTYEPVKLGEVLYCYGAVILQYASTYNLFVWALQYCCLLLDLCEVQMFELSIGKWSWFLFRSCFYVTVCLSHYLVFYFLGIFVFLQCILWFYILLDALWWIGQSPQFVCPFTYCSLCKRWIAYSFITFLPLCVYRYLVDY